MLNVVVSDIMNDHPIKVKAGVSMRNVAHLLLRYRINGILVVDEDKEESLLGVFTTVDFLNLMGLAISGLPQKMAALDALADQPVGKFVNRQFLRIEHTDHADKAIGLMLKHNVPTIPVYAGDKLVGVIGRHDIINIAFA